MDFVASRRFPSDDDGRVIVDPHVLPARHAERIRQFRALRPGATEAFRLRFVVAPSATLLPSIDPTFMSTHGPPGVPVVSTTVVTSPLVDGSLPDVDVEAPGPVDSSIVPVDVPSVASPGGSAVGSTTRRSCRSSPAWRPVDRRCTRRGRQRS